MSSEEEADGWSQAGPSSWRRVPIAARFCAASALLLLGFVAAPTELGLWHWAPRNQSRWTPTRKLLDLKLKAWSPPAPRPVFFMHGLTANAYLMGQIAFWVRQAFPGTKTFCIPVYENEKSFTSLLAQLPDVAQYIRYVVRNNPKDFEGGYDLIGHSQGGMISRTLVEYMDDHAVHTLISMAGPQSGVYGDKVSENSGLDKANFQTMLLKVDLSKMMFFNSLQESNSVANMWNDPLDHSDYVKRNMFLPVYAGLTDDPRNNERRKANFCRLSKAVFLVGDYGATPYEGGIEPWQSGIFGFYADGSDKEIVPMRKTQIYLDDTFGLKTLDESGRLILKSPPGISHGAWVTDYNVVKEYVLPHLDPHHDSKQDSKQDGKHHSKHHSKDCQ